MVEWKKKLMTMVIAALVVYNDMHPRVRCFPAVFKDAPRRRSDVVGVDPLPKETMKS